MILQTEITNLNICTEQQGYLEQLMNILSTAQQGMIPTQVHQQIQQLLKPYRQEGLEACPDENPMTVNQETQGRLLTRTVHLLTATQKQWTLYLIAHSSAEVQRSCI